MSVRRLWLGVLTVFCALFAVYVFGSVAALAAAPEAPGPVSVSPVGATRATVHGVLSPNAEGHPGTYEFLYKKVSLTCEGESHAPESPGLMLGFEHEEVAEGLTGLEPNTEYAVCLLARNSKGEESVGPVTTFTTAPVLEAPMTKEPATGVTATTATLEGVLNPGSPGEAGTYEFLYRASTTECQGAGGSGGSALGGAKEAVTAQVSGLLPSTVYSFCLLARNGAGETAVGPPVKFTTSALPPVMEGVSFADVGSSSATLSGRVDPGGLVSSYRFEYSSDGVHWTKTPQPPGSVSGQTDTSISTHLNGLQPGTTYDFRLVVSSSDGTAESTEASFSTLQLEILGLPDNRGYEMVSPLTNADSNVYEPFNYDNSLSEESTPLPFQTAADGDAIVYVAGPSATSGSGSEGREARNEYLAARSPSGGWSAVNITPPAASVFEEPLYEAFSNDLSVGILDWNGLEPLTAGALGGEYNVLYTRTSGDGSYHPLFTTTPPKRTPQQFEAYEVQHRESVNGLVYAGASSNFEHVLFEANDALTKVAEASPPEQDENDLYDSVAGQPYLVNVPPGGAPAPNAVFGAPVASPHDESIKGGFFNEIPREAAPDFSHVISEDGSRVFWTTLEVGEEEHELPKALYVRENDTQPESPLGEKGECTVPADACTVLIAEGARFWTATPDGSKVLYRKAGDLYEYDVNTDQSTDLTPGGGVIGVTATSEDLSYVYFVAKGALAPGAEPRECNAREARGEFEKQEPEDPAFGCNLYVLHEGEPVRFIARLSSRDNEVEPLQVSGDWRPGLGNRTAEATSDGAHLVFMSVANLTGYESEGLPEVYVYDAEGAGRLFCASCKQSGEPPMLASAKQLLRYSAFLQPSNSNTYIPRWMSANGTRVFFDSIDALVPQDTNGLLDVYEWEQDGTGSCTEASGESVSESADKREKGCIYLLSGGTSTDNSFFADASVSGEDVFMVTRAQLVPQDQDENFNMFDARVGAGPPPTPPQCTGTGCQGVPGAPPVFATPSSVTFNGVGNFSGPVTTAVKGKAKTPTRAQKLARALRACGKQSKRKRTVCEAQARKHYGAGSKAKRSAKGRK